ncbi:glucuronyl hydrolase, partial [Enterococcus faecalis]
MCSQENNQRLISLGENVSDEWIQTQLNECVSKIAKNMQRFGTLFPSACATNGRYRLKANDD